MRKIRASHGTRLLLAIFFCTSVLLSTGAQEPKGKQSETVAFVNVTVIPMDRERSLENQTVIVRDGRVSQLGPAAQIKVPEGARRIDGKGKYLMPGLADMHVHLGPGAGIDNDPAAQLMTILLANGVTTVRGMIGNPGHVTLRDRVARGEVLGPAIYASSPPMLGNNTPNPEAGAQAVAEFKKTGYDLIKVHEGLSPETYEAIAGKARELNIPIAGHVTASVGLSRALEARQSTIEHLDGYLRALVPDDSPVKPPPGQFVIGPVLNHVDESRIAALAQQTRQAGVFNTPTLALFKMVLSREQPDELLKWEEMQYVSAAVRTNFAKQKQGTANIPASDAERQRFVELRNKLVRELHKAGARLLVGSDSPQLFFVPGFATHREIREFVAAGLTPYAAIEAATRNGAEYLGKLNEFGTVEVGKRADLLLLDANPLQNVANLSKRAGVMVNGRWISQNELQSKLEVFARLHAAPAKQ